MLSATHHLQPVAMVTITKPLRQQWEAGWEGKEGKAAALRDERKLVAGVEKDWQYTEKRGRKANGDVAGWEEEGEEVREDKQANEL